jgi:tetratricopeptide (TPR) repeat protein
MEDAKQAVARSENEAALDTLGWIYVGLGHYPEAVAELSRAIRLKPDYALPYYHLGEAYRRSSQFEEATSILTDGKALAEAGKDAVLLSLMSASRAKIEQRDPKP